MENSNYLEPGILSTASMLDDEHKQPEEPWQCESNAQRTPPSLHLSKSSTFPSMDGAENLQFKPFLASASTFPLLRDSVPSVSSSMDERLLSVIRYAEAAGFDCFDDLVSAYYLSDFENDSLLVNEQHLSRKRRLPQVISDIFQAASYWTNWERHGFYEEVLKAAESVLSAEAAASRESLLAKAMTLIDPASHSSAADKANSIRELKTFTQNNVSLKTFRKITVFDLKRM